MDLFGPIKASDKQARYVVVMTDAFSKLVQLRAVKSKEASEVAKAFLEGWCYTYGIPKTIVTDQGKEFCNDFTRALLTGLQIEHEATTPYHPQTNAQAEVFNKTLAHYLRTILAEAHKSTIDWELYLAPLVFSHNTAVHKSARVSPFYTTFGYDPRVPMWDDHGLLEELGQEIKKHGHADNYYRLKSAQNTARRTVQNNLQHAQEEQARAHAKANTPEIGRAHV
jgi:transposase InsO family protein